MTRFEGPVEAVVREILLQLGWTRTEGTDEHSISRGRTTFRLQLQDAVDFALVHGVEALEGKLVGERTKLERSSHRNRFLERRAHTVFSNEMKRRISEYARVEGSDE